MVDEILPPVPPAEPPKPTATDRPYDGPNCPQCQAPTRSCCLGARCPWLICSGIAKHTVRTVYRGEPDSHVQGEPTEFKLDTRGLNAGPTDGVNDTRGKAYWNRIYAQDKPYGDPKDTKP